MHRSPESHPWERRLGATPTGDGLTEFRAWAPRAADVAVRLHGSDHVLADAGGGMREARVEVRPLAAFAKILAPFTPMLFMGDEYGERAPFRFASCP